MPYVPKSKKLKPETPEENLARRRKMTLPELIAYYQAGQLKPVSSEENERRMAFERQDMMDYADKLDMLTARMEQLESKASAARAKAESYRIPSERERLLDIVSKVRDRSGKVTIPPAFVAEKTESEDEEERLDKQDAKFLSLVLDHNFKHFHEGKPSFRPPQQRDLASEQRSAARRDTMREAMSKFGESDAGVMRLEGFTLPEHLRSKDAEIAALENAAYGKLEGEGMIRPKVLRRRAYFQ